MVVKVYISGISGNKEVSLILEKILGQPGAFLNFFQC